ncbi:MAG: nucleotidyltransferase domain-containing protein [Deltaproteobacteria bacterium]|nr:nucleotidyltransferase domain-containing protein [Deltaproteobacteria bacterium]
MMIDIEKEIKDITEQIVDKYKPEKVILFGSAARGEFTPDSDLDMLIIKKDTPFYGIDRMRELDRMIKKGVAADFLVYRPEEIEKRLQMGDPFIKAIFKEGKVLYG